MAQELTEELKVLVTAEVSKAVRKLKDVDKQAEQTEKLFKGLGKTIAATFTAKAILDGTEQGAKRDVVLLNAGATLYIGGLADSIAEGIKLAAESIDSGKALKVLEKMVELSN